MKKDLKYVAGKVEGSKWCPRHIMLFYDNHWICNSFVFFSGKWEKEMWKNQSISMLPTLKMVAKLSKGRKW